MRVIGTAGHVDHGKSTLIAALTGVHPDRLKEEQEREMTIDLGFGWLTLPDGEEIGIVDVPGHRDFIGNMLSGIGGIDAALLVVAADEGVMPQTREHLAILDLLQIRTAVIVITKTDLATDPEWIALVERDVRALTAGTALQGAPLVRVSAAERVGLDELLAALAAVLRERPARPDLARPRLPVDRVFSMSGFGTVVTGTLSDGRLAVDDEIEVLPSGARGRVRGLQTHKKIETTAVAGSRTAVNISGISTEEIRRGDVVAHPGDYRPTRRADARFRALRDSAAPIEHASEVKLFVGASETIARVRLLDAESLQPGDEGWIQLELREPIVAVRGDRYVLRRPSPGETLGGGTIVDPEPDGRHKRFDQGVQASLAALARGRPSDVLMESASALQGAPVSIIIERARLDPAAARTALQELLDSGSLIALEAAPRESFDQMLVMPAQRWNEVREQIVQLLQTHHRISPLRPGIPRGELKSRLALETRMFNAIIDRLEAEGALKESGKAIALPDHRIAFDAGQQAAIENLLREFAARPYAPPSLKESQASLGKEVLEAVLASGELVAVSDEVVFRKVDYDVMVAGIEGALKMRGAITLAEVRDLFDTSRKYAQALLEHLDQAGLTERDGDARKLKHPNT